MSVEDHQVSFSLEVNVEKAYEDIRRVQTILYRLLSLFSRMGLGPNVDSAIANIQRLITMLNTLRLTMIAVQTASGPIGWAMAGISIAETAIMFGDTLELGMDTH